MDVPGPVRLDDTTLMCIDADKLPVDTQQELADWEPRDEGHLADAMLYGTRPSPPDRWKK